MSTHDEIIPEFNASVGVKGRYKLIRRDAQLNVVEETNWFDNLVVDGGLNALLNVGNPNPFTIRAVAGSGSATPAISNTALASYLGACKNIFSTTSAVNSSTSPYWARTTITFRGDQGSVVGNVSEVGVAMVFSPSSTSSTSPLFSRSLVVDSNGNATSVTVLSDEYLDIVWEYTEYMTVSSGTFNQVIDGTTASFTYTTAPCNLSTIAKQANGGWAILDAGSFDGGLFSIYPYVSSDGVRVYESNTLAPYSSNPGNTYGKVTSVIADTYTSSSHQRSWTVTTALSEGNFSTGIGLWMIGMGNFCFQMSLGTKVMKTSTKTYSLKFKVSLANA